MPSRTPLGVGERVAAAARLEAADEHVVGRVEEEHAGARAVRAELGERLVEVVRRTTPERTSTTEAVALRAAPAAGELGDLADERGRQVVDDEEAEVLEHVGRRRTVRRPTSR